MKSTLKEFARDLRKKSTESERTLWRHLKAKRFENLKWKRQAPIGKYIADFICLEKRIIIECDGGQHSSQNIEDEKRDCWFEERGYKGLRFWNSDILKNLNVVLEAIWKATLDPPLPNPPPPGGREQPNKIQGLYAICDISFSSHKSQHELAQQLLAGGAKILQLRMKDEKDLNLVREQAQKILEEKKNSNFCFILNDYVELARELKVDGVHVGENDLPVSEVRKIVGPQMLIGYSSHSIAEAKQAEIDGADYIALGAIFPTATKGPGHPVQGLEKLRELVVQVSIPKVAIGGITLSNIDPVLQTGVDAIAMITALSKAPDVSAETALYVKKIATFPKNTR